MKKTALVILSILLIGVAQAAQVVEVKQDTPQQQTGLWASIKALFSSPWFYGAIAIFLALLAIAVVSYFIIKWIIQYIKSRSDVYFLMKKQRIKMAKVMKSFPASHFWRVTKNTPIRLVRTENGVPRVSRPIAYHRGDMKTHEGNICLAVNFVGKKKWLFFPETDLLIIPDKRKIEIEQRDEDKESEIVELEMPEASKIIQFHEDEILIYADSISQQGYFFFPVITTTDGQIIDLSLPTYQQLKKVAIGDFLYEQSAQFVIMTKKAVEQNPNVKIQQKIGDTNQAVDVNTGNP